MISESDQLLADLSDKTYTPKSRVRIHNERRLSWARQKRDELIQLMGARCQHPECENPNASLQFHHRKRCRTWIARQKNQVMRTDTLSPRVQSGHAFAALQSL